MYIFFSRIGFIAAYNKAVKGHAYPYFSKHQHLIFLWFWKGCHFHSYTEEKNNFQGEVKAWGRYKGKPFLQYCLWPFRFISSKHIQSSVIEEENNALLLHTISDLLAKCLHLWFKVFLHVALKHICLAFTLSWEFSCVNNLCHLTN